MNETYVYGYRGFERNEHIDEINNLMDSFNEQLAELDKIDNARRTLMSEFARNNKDVSDEELRQMYFDDNISMPFEQYGQEILIERQSKQNILSLELERNRYEYNANSRYLQNVIDDTLPSINQKLREVERKLRELDIEFSKLNLENSVQYDANRQVVNSDGLKELDKRRNEVWLEILKYRQVYEKLEQMRITLKESLEKYSLGLRTLNPQEREIYDNIKKKRNITPGPVPGPTPGPVPGPVPGPTPGPVPGPVPGPENDELLEEIEKYKNALSEYNELLNEYKEELGKFYELQRRYELGELLDYKEFYRQVFYIEDFYKRVLDAYNQVKNMFDALQEKIAKALSDKKTTAELQDELAALQSEFDSLYHESVHRANGEVPYDLDEIQNKINKVKKEIENKKFYDDIQAPVEPEEPSITFDPIQKEEQIDDNIMDARKILILLENQEEFKKGDNFALKYKDVKLFGWKKYKERTILDKPIRLVKLGTGGIIKAPLKVMAKLSYLSKSKRINALKERVNKLSSKQLDVLIDYGITKLKEFRPQEIVLTALLPRLNERLNERLIINNNILAKMKREIVDLYDEATKILAILRKGDLDSKTKADNEYKFKQISKQLLNLIINSKNLKEETDKLINPARLGDAFSISKNLRVGGFYSKNDIDQDANAVDLVFGDRLEKAIENGDGYKAAEAIISRDKLDLKNTKTKKTLRNKGGETSVGSRYFSPFIEWEDYEKNPYISNLMQTGILIMTITNVFRQMELQKELDQYRQIIDVQNQTIQTLQTRYSILKNKALVELDPATQQAFADDLRQCALVQSGQIQGLCEDFAQKAAAGASKASSPIIDSSNPIYNQYDTLAHTTTSQFTKAINSIPTNISPAQQVQQIEQITNNMHTFIANFTANTMTNVSAYMATKTGFDFTAEQVFAQTITQANPTLAVNLNSRLLDLAEGIVNLPTLNQIQTLTANADIAGSITVLAGVLGKDVVESELRETLSSGKGLVASELTEDYIEKLESIELTEEKKARDEFDRKQKEWDSKSFWYKIFHRKEKPNYNDSYRDLISEEAEEIYGRGL